MEPLGIAIVGSGNVAAHLAQALAGHVAVVASRNTDHARALADAAGIPAACGLADLAALAPKAVIFSLADHAMADAVAAVGALPGQPVVMHTSGTLPMQTLAPVSPRYGVLYPLQTFSRNVGVDFRRIPVFTEGADAATLAVIDGLASLLSAPCAMPTRASAACCISPASSRRTSPTPFSKSCRAYSLPKGTLSTQSNPSSRPPWPKPSPAASTRRRRASPCEATPM